MTVEDAKLYGAIVTIILAPLSFFIAAATLYLNFPHILRQRRDAISAITSGDATTVGQEAEKGSPKIRIWPISVMVISFILVVLSAYTLGSAVTKVGGIGPQGIQGERGPQGPPGPSGANETTQRAVRALLRLRSLDAHLRAIKDDMEKFENQYKDRLDHLKIPPSPISAYPRTIYGMFAIENYLVNIKRYALEDIDMDVTFGKHPAFDDNHLTPMPGDENIVDQRQKEDYRRIYNTYQEDKSKLNSIIYKYEIAIATENTTIDSILRAEQH
jgi:hypothetical protein